MHNQPDKLVRHIACETSSAREVSFAGALLILLQTMRNRAWRPAAHPRKNASRLPKWNNAESEIDASFPSMRPKNTSIGN